MSDGAACIGQEGRLLDLIGDVCGLLDIDELRHGMLRALTRALPSTYVSLNEVRPNPRDIVTLIEPEASPGLLATWMDLAHENPLLRYYQRTLDGRATRLSDVTDSEELHALPLYRELYRPMGVQYQMAFTLPARAERVLAIALSRGEQDYSDEERDFVNRARPFLIQAYLNAIAFSRLRDVDGDGAEHARQSTVTLAGRRDPGERDGEGGAGRLLDALRDTGLTRREAEVTRLVALGRSNHHVAADLGISYRTVGKHLEHSFRKLGVSDRSTAAACAWRLAGSSPAERTNGGYSPVTGAMHAHLESSVAMLEPAGGILDGRGVAKALEHTGIAGNQPEREGQKRQC